MGPKFRKNNQKTLCFLSKNEPHGTLNRIQTIHRKRNIWSRTDPGFSAPGVRITVVYTNSLKLTSASIHKMPSENVIESELHSKWPRLARVRMCVRAQRAVLQ